MQIVLNACSVTLSEWKSIEIGDELKNPIDLRKWGAKKAKSSDFLLPIKGKEMDIDLYGILSHQFSNSWEARFVNPLGNLNEFHTVAEVIRYEYKNASDKTVMPVKHEFAEIIIYTFPYSKTNDAAPVGPSSLIRLRCNEVVR